MSFIKNLNKKLNNMFEGQVEAQEDSGYLILSGELKKWSEVLLACRLAVENTPYFGLVNNIVCTGEKVPPVRKPGINDSVLAREEPDVLIIGGGIIGCSIARELSKYKLSILLVEKEHDIAMQASGRNTGLVHSGAGIRKGSQMHKFSRRGNAMYENLCADLGVVFKRSGQYIYMTKRFWDPFLFLTSLYWKWHGIKDVRVIKRDELHKFEPAISKDIGAALYSPSAGVVNPFDLTIAYAENAVQNGAVFSLDTMVESMVTENGVVKSVKTNRGTIKPKLVVNAAGVFCEYIAALAGDRFYSIRPRKGTIAVIDGKYADEVIQTVLTPIGKTSDKKKHTKGCSVIRTSEGSILVGPDSFDTINKEDYSTSPYNIKEIFKSQARIVPKLDEKQVITYFSGVSAATFEDDFVVSKGRQISNILHAAGIQSPGLTAAPAISTEVTQMVVDFFGGENSVSENPEYNSKRLAPVRPSQLSDSERSELIEANPDYGIIICRCKEISKGEILDALRQNIKCTSLDGVKRRVGACMGRCHGSHCTPLILDIIATEKRLPPQTIRKSSSGSEVLFGLSKTLQQKKSTTEQRISDPESKTDPMLVALLHQRAEEAAMALDEQNRKDSEDDDYE